MANHRFPFKRLAAVAATILAALTASAALAAPAVTPLVSTEWLANHLKDEGLVILDPRSATTVSGDELYAKGHVPGALSAPYPGIWRSKQDGVVGMLPPVGDLEAGLSALGVSNETAVVIVPNGVSASEFGAAARIYWTLKYLGHDAVAILDGGLTAWNNEGRPLEIGESTPTPATFRANIRKELLASTADVEQAMQSSRMLVDARPAAQFSGAKKHPQATRFGHIPGALNVDQSQFYDAKQNRLKSRDEIAGLLPASLRDDKGSDVISLCNTGHWAATNWFVLTQVLGRENVTLYDASMVGWSQNAALPMEASEEPQPD